ncbi:hypothetical protein [Ancylobacter sp.]|uniref:hypothetical protein n=1 Tax=Ancylobacter sp. TaxID=1872567 RepID=UPI003D09B262
MRKVSRTAKGPDALQTRGAKELENATKHFEGPAPSEGSFKFSAYKHDEVHAALEGLFHGKCAYCETFYANSAPMDVEHYRPKGAVEGDKEHRGYWWIAMAWENLLPSCIDCNRKRRQITPDGNESQVKLLDGSLAFAKSVTMTSGKKDSFPLAVGGVRAKTRHDAYDAEMALLINPCEDDPADHLAYRFVGDRVVSLITAKPLAGPPAYVGPGGLSLKGTTSIHQYGLNRIGLVQARTELVRRLAFMTNMVIDLKELAEDLAGVPGSHPQLVRARQAVDVLAERLLAELQQSTHPSRAYSATAKAWLASKADEIEGIL